jgi:hypothetical protein
METQSSRPPPKIRGAAMYPISWASAGCQGFASPGRNPALDRPSEAIVRMVTSLKG